MGADRQVLWETRLEGGIVRVCRLGRTLYVVQVSVVQACDVNEVEARNWSKAFEIAAANVARLRSAADALAKLETALERSEADGT